MTDVLFRCPYAFLGSRLKRLAEQMQADASNLAAQAGVSVPPGLYPILAVLDGERSPTITQLARLMHVSQPAMTKSIAKLEDEGLVSIRKSETDGRQSLVVLTAPGKVAVENGRMRIWPLIDAVVREVADGLSGSLIEQIEEMELRLKQASLKDRAARLAEIELQRASHGDVAEVVSLLNRAYRGSGEDASWTTEAGLIDGDRDNEPMLRQELADKPDARLMVWKPDGKVEGCVWLEPADDRHWYLGSFAIDPRMQNNQAGRRLLAAAEDTIREQSGRVIKMTVIDSRDSLIAWYERRGYRRTGETIPFPYSETRFGVPREAGLRFAVLSKELEYF
ncbi:GNAT family N-acetyltransferase [Pseudoroseomonas wenyumeiae]